MYVSYFIYSSIFLFKILFAISSQTLFQNDSLHLRLGTGIYF